MLADAAILGEHHSSAVPRVVGLPRSDLRPDGLATQVVLLRQELRELRAMVSALLLAAVAKDAVTARDASTPAGDVAAMVVVAARGAPAPAGDAAAKNAVTACAASVPLVAVVAKDAVAASEAYTPAVDVVA